MPLMLFLLLVAFPAAANDWHFDVEAQYTLTAVAADYDGVHSWRHMNVGIGYRSFNLRAGFERGRDQWYGQPMGRFDAATLEGSYRFKATDKLTVELGLGYWHPLWVQRHDEIIDEMAYTHLVNRHANRGRPIPLRPVNPNPQGFQQEFVGCMTQDARGRDRHPNCFDAAYEYKPSPYARAGVSYSVTDHIELSLNYRLLRAWNYVAIGLNDGRIFMAPKDAPGGWWMEDGRRNFDTLSVGLRWRF